MIDSLSIHGIEAKDLVPALMTTHTVANPEYDPAEAHREAERQTEEAASHLEDMESDSEDIGNPPSAPSSPNPGSEVSSPQPDSKPAQTTARVLEGSTAVSMPGISTSLSTTEKDVTLDIRWTVLCDLFLVLIADSVYDARSRVLLEQVALKLGLGWLDVVRFERRVTEALEIQEETENLEQREVIESVKKSSRKRRFMMLGLATLGMFHPVAVPHSISLKPCARWWSCHWSFGWSSRSSHWSRSGCCLHNDRYHWNHRISGWCGWRRSHHHWRCTHWLWNCGQGYG